MRLVSWVNLSKAEAIALFLLSSKTLARKNKKKEITSLARDDEFYDVYDIEKLYIEVICVSFEEVAARGFEDSLLKMYGDEFIECGSKRNVTIVQLVKFDPDLDCDKNLLLDDEGVGGDRKIKRKKKI